MDVYQIKHICCLPYSVVGLIATIPNRTDLLIRAAQSIAKQSHPLDALVIVGDIAPVSEYVRTRLTRTLSGLAIHFLNNTGTSGAAGSWNTGVRHISECWPHAYIAMLDDDDEWAPDHISSCFVCAQGNDWPDGIVSGLRLVKDGEEIYRPPPTRLALQDFLEGNPGWQGSNTFIRVRSLLAAGLFTEGLASCNDRDLAIRVLSLPSVRFGFTQKHTATWHLDSQRRSLSSQRGEAKRVGLAQFFRLHGHLMSAGNKQRFFDRALELFAWTEEEIIGAKGSDIDV